MADRALNEAVARAMGWVKPSERGHCDVCGWKVVPHPESGCWADNCSMRPHPEPRADRCAAYTTDPATQAEMLGWLLQSTNGSVAIDVDDTASVRCRALPGTEEIGATINEALARVVVAVAAKEARREVAP